MDAISCYLDSLNINMATLLVKTDWRASNFRSVNNTLLVGHKLMSIDKINGNISFPNTKLVT